MECVTKCNLKTIVTGTMFLGSASVLYLKRSNPYVAPLLAIGLLAAIVSDKCGKNFKEWVIAPILIPVVLVCWWRLEPSSNGWL